MAQLSDAIAKMREDVRATYVDIRMKARVLKSMIDFIKSLQIPKFQETRVDQQVRLRVVVWLV